MPSLVHREITVRFTLGTGAFGESGYDTVELSGLRVSATISRAGTPAANSAVIRIFGMTPSQMAQLSQLGVLMDTVRANFVALMAGAGGADMVLAFSGGIWTAYPDFTDAPEVAFVVTASTALLAQMKPAVPVTYKGSINIAAPGGLLATLAAQMGYTFQNPAGIAPILTNPYLPGCARAQALAAADAADIYLIFDDDPVPPNPGTMLILPKDGARSNAAPLISPSTGLVLYPQYSGPGYVRFRTLFNSQIRFLGLVSVQSPAAEVATVPSNGLWRVTSLTHILESWTPNGQWFSEVEASRYLAQQ